MKNRCPEVPHYHLDVILTEAEAREMQDFCKMVLDRKEGMDVKITIGDDELNEYTFATVAFKTSIGQIFGQAINLIIEKGRSH